MTTKSGQLTKPYKTDIVWGNVMFALVYHLIAFQALYYIFTFKVKWPTLIWTFLLFICANIGITAGVHRLWCHRTYKAKLPLRILLCFFHTIGFQNSIYQWTRDHRVHHKFTDTDADPYNINRGFFFAHMGWLMVKKHPEVITKGKAIDLSDLLADPVVRFQSKCFVPMGFALSVGMPAIIPWYFWNDDLYTGFAVAGVLRYMLSLHAVCCVNSVAHMWGYKPYDKSIKAVENAVVSHLMAGEGWHNYHHCFPWDYKAAELDNYNGNLATGFIDFMAKIGWAYDLKSACRDVIEHKIRQAAAM